MYIQLPKLLTQNLSQLFVLQHLADIENTDSKEGISCLKRTIYSGRRKKCNFQDLYRQPQDCRGPLPIQILLQR